MMSLAFHEERTVKVSTTLNLVRNRNRCKEYTRYIAGNCFSNFGIYYKRLNPSSSSIFPLLQRIINGYNHFKYPSTTLYDGHIILVK